MKKSVKGIIGLSVLLAALGGGAAALLLTEPEGGDDSSSSLVSEPEKQVKLLIHDDKVTGTDPETGADLEGVIKSVAVKNSKDEYTVVQKASENADEDIRYTIDGFQEVPLNTLVVGTLANNANGLTSEDVVEENPADLEKFGLAKPEITVDITYETGTAYRMFIGSKAPVGDATYVMIDGVDAVYTVRNSALANYSNGVIDFVDSTILAAPEVYPVVEKLTVSRKDTEQDLVIEYDAPKDDNANRGGTSSSHIMTNPTFAYLTVEKATDIITGMFGLVSDDVYIVKCTESDIAEAGLKEPFCTVTMECDDGNDYKLLLSEYFDVDGGKNCYAMLEGGSVIYILDEESSKWLTVQPVDVASRIFIASYVWNITDLTLKCGDESCDFDIEQISTPGEDEKLTATNFSVELNGEKFDSERYRQFYSFLIKANGESFALGEEIPAGEPMAVLEYTDGYLEKTMKFEFYEVSALQALVVADGESKFNISKSYVETMIENAENLKSDTEFKTTWK
ncbi:MAG: DUF4340 domain-containing protein [Ruminococcus sp.]|nr:DUF4340 domain-containing protein [Ruminococcus sp.]